MFIRFSTGFREFFPSQSYRSSWDPSWIDFWTSLGVLHHLPVPFDGFSHLMRALKPKGIFSFWIYSRESNGLFIYFIEPLKKAFLTKLPHGLLNILLMPLSLFVFLVVQL